MHFYYFINSFSGAKPMAQIYHEIYHSCCRISYTNGFKQFFHWYCEFNSPPMGTTVILNEWIINYSPEESWSCVSRSPAEWEDDILDPCGEHTAKQRAWIRIRLVSGRCGQGGWLRRRRKPRLLPPQKRSRRRRRKDDRQAGTAFGVNVNCMCIKKCFGCCGEACRLHSLLLTSLFAKAILKSEVVGWIFSW